MNLMMGAGAGGMPADRVRQAEAPWCKRWMLSLLSGFVLFSASIKAEAQIEMSGTFSFSRSGSIVTLSVDKISNYYPFYTFSGTLALELWATDFPYFGGGLLQGYKLCHVQVGTLQGGYYFGNVVRTTSFAEPPPGNYNLVFVVSEWDGFSWVLDDYGNFYERETFGIYPPVITSSLNAAGRVGSYLTYQILASHGPTYYSASGLPPGLACDPVTGLIYGTPSNAGVYWATISAGNLAGVANRSLTFSISGVRPTITSQPQSQTVLAGSGVTLFVLAQASPPPSYQWKFNGNNIAGGTSSAYTIPSARFSDAGKYKVVLSNSAGSVTSAVATLTVIAPPMITMNPADRSIKSGGAVTFSVGASGSKPMHYQWFRDGAPISGATSASYSIGTVRPKHAGQYKALVSNAAGAAESAAALLTVKYAPSIVSQPQAQTVAAGEDAAFSVVAAGVPDPVYTWRFKGKPIPGANSSTFQVLNAQPASAGNYSVVVANSIGSVTSAVAVLKVLLPPTITMHPQGWAVQPGSNVTLSVSALGTAPLCFRWFWIGETGLTNSAPGWTNSTFRLNDIQAQNAGSYYVVVTNVVGQATSQMAVLTILPPSFKNSEPASPGPASLEAVRTPDGTFALRVNDAVGTTNQVELSTDLITWAPCGPPFVATNGVMLQQIETKDSRGFFRLRQVQ